MKTISNSILGRHLLSIGTVDETIEWYREQALQSSWKPIISFRDDAKDQLLNYQTVEFLFSLRNFDLVFILVVVD